MKDLERIALNRIIELSEELITVMSLKELNFNDHILPNTKFK